MCVCRKRTEKRRNDNYDLLMSCSTNSSQSNPIGQIFDNGLISNTLPTPVAVETKDDISNGITKTL